MKNNNRIAFLLGAGFSVPAGMPTANNLNRIIISMIYNNVRKSVQDGEGAGMLLKSFILEKVLLDYDVRNEGFSYEKYFDLLVKESNEQLNEDKLLSFIERGMYGYFWHCSRGNDGDVETHTKQIHDIQKSIIAKSNEYDKYVEEVCEWYQSMIAENIKGHTMNGKIDTFNPCYQGFINILSQYIKEEYEIDIYTLNHDLYLESLISLTELKDKVSNGFGGEIKKINNKSYETFDIQYYKDKIKIYKLHGSIDVHELTYENNRNKNYIRLVDGYSEKNRFLLDDGQFASILPLFLTGETVKQKMYLKEPYKTMLGEFEKNIKEAKKLIVIGYSGNDEGINEILDKNYKDWNNAYIVSPSARNHQFVKTKNAKPIIKGVEDLIINDL